MSKLYVTRDNTTSGDGMWWLVWAVPGESTFVGDEGYCFRHMFRTRRQAVEYGKRHGVIATYWPQRSDTAPKKGKVR